MEDRQHENTRVTAEAQIHSKINQDWHENRGKDHKHGNMHAYRDKLLIVAKDITDFKSWMKEYYKKLVGESGVKPGGRVQTGYLTFGLASAATYRLMPELRPVVEEEAEDASPCFFDVLYSCCV
ncbi:hypothetical protein J6590_054516 [Homalodisca vitripennis]|nr:hypothetical protein J6590_054516 [Homalodisca vitripennis]